MHSGSDSPPIQVKPHHAALTTCVSAAHPAGQTELHSANFLLFKIKRVLLTGAVIYDLVLQKRFDAAQRLFGIVMAYVHSSGQVVTFQDLVSAAGVVMPSSGLGQAAGGVDAALAFTWTCDWTTT
jgi:hypothetical protein